jgi:pseudouridine-5'-monophosphatase
MKVRRQQESITHVIYDVDGLLLDTERFYTQAYQIIAARYGKTYDWSIKRRTIGMKAKDSARIIIDALGLPFTTEQWLESRKSLLEELFPKAEPLPGAQRLTRHLKGCGIPQAVATSSDRHYFDLKTSRHRDWFAIFDCLVSGDDHEVNEGKPAPDIFLIAARRMRARPACCLVFEDAPAGVQAARLAGMSVIAVPDSNLEESAFGDAHQVLRSLEQFDPALWGLPPFPSDG